MHGLSWIPEFTDSTRLAGQYSENPLVFASPLLGLCAYATVFGFGARIMYSGPNAYTTGTVLADPAA